MTVTHKKNLDGTNTDKILLVLDPRMLNKVLPVDNHQLPLINDIFNSTVAVKTGRMFSYFA